MPFTLAHPAAVLPIRGLLRRHTVLSALVIGSMTPDLGTSKGLRPASTLPSRPG